MYLYSHNNGSKLCDNTYSIHSTMLKTKKKKKKKQKIIVSLVDSSSSESEHETPLKSRDSKIPPTQPLASTHKQKL